MSSTYSPIYLHLVFAVKNRESLILPEWQKEIHAYLSGILSRRGHIPVIVGGVENHVHLLFRYNITELIPDLVRELKTNSGKFISTKFPLHGRFYWQGGYGCFSVSYSKLDNVKSYIANQTQHHGQRTFREEMVGFLKGYNVDFDERYLPEDI
ncbi:MAG: transposase [Bacteroides sp.]|nr:transposase [Bacteroides sp.]MBD5375313.1 transposase [Bacteroides sp.]